MSQNYKFELLLIIVFFCGISKAKFRPLDFDDNDYYLTMGSQVPSKSLIEDIRRGHEGLLVKLQELTRALKEDEVKMNNVFYQLGQHNNDLKAISKTIGIVSESGRATDAHVNRQAYNVDFLRRSVNKLTHFMEDSQKKTTKIETLEQTVSKLEDRLTIALSKLAVRENPLLLNDEATTENNDVYYSARAPTLITKPVSDKGGCPTGWTNTGSGCYWVSGEEASYSAAVSNCVKLGAHLTGLPKKKELKILRKHMLKDKKYWTSATNAYSASSQWSFLMTGESLPQSYWENATDPWNYKTMHCAVLSSNGLAPARCSKKYKYICETI